MYLNSVFGVSHSKYFLCLIQQNQSIICIYMDYMHISEPKLLHFQFRMIQQYQIVSFLHKTRIRCSISNSDLITGPSQTMYITCIDSTCMLVIMKWKTLSIFSKAEMPFCTSMIVCLSMH